RLSDFARIEGDLNRLKRDVERNERRKDREKREEDARKAEQEKQRRAEEARRAALPPTVGDRIKVIDEIPGVDIDLGAEGLVQADNGRGLPRIAFETPEGRTRSILTSIKYLQKVRPKPPEAAPAEATASEPPAAGAEATTETEPAERAAS